MGTEIAGSLSHVYDEDFAAAARPKILIALNGDY
jgi:hypothetical protein